MILIMVMMIFAAVLVVGLIVCKCFGRKRLQKEKAEPDIFLMILPSVLGIGVCCLCLIGGTYAWFTANVITPAQTMQAAYYDITVSVTCGTETIAPDPTGVYTLSPQTDDDENTIGYTVTLTASGTATTGYCKITRLSAAGTAVDAGQTDTDTADGTVVDTAQADTVAADGTVFYTVQINNTTEQANTLTFTIYPTTADEQYTFEAVWGTYSGTDGRIVSGGVIGTQPPVTEAPSTEAETTTDGTGDAAGSSDGTVENTEGVSDVTETQSGTEAQTAAEETQSETEAQTAVDETQPETGEQDDVTETQSETEAQATMTESRFESGQTAAEETQSGTEAQTTAEEDTGETAYGSEPMP